MADDTTEGGGGPSATDSEKALKLAQALLDAKKEESKLSERLLSANMQNNVVQGEMFVRMGQMNQAAQAFEAAQKAHKELVNRMEKSITSEKALQQEFDDAVRAGDPKAIEAAQKKLKAAEDLRDVLELELKDSEQRLDNLDEATKKYRELSKAGREVHDESKKQFEAIGGLLFGITQAQNTMVGSGLMFANTLVKAVKAGDGLGMAFKSVFNLANIGASMAEKVVESFMKMFTALDKTAASFAAATGTGREYVGSLENMTKEQAHLGVSMANNSQALSGLLDEMIGFTHMSKEGQEALASQVAQFDRLGIKGEEVGGLINTFGSIMGATADEAVDLTRELALMGASIGISSKKMIKDFQQAQKTLAVYGKQSVGIFRNMAAAAKAAGVEMNTLLGIASKFDTFEDAADSTAKLNAILGSNLSATRMLMMTEDQRIETLIMQVQASGQSFAQMDRFKQKAIANAAGITDMAEANKIFGMSMSKYRSYTQEMKQAETGQQKMEEAIKATVPIQEMLANMMVQFAPDVTAALEFVRGLIEGISASLKFLNDMTGGTFPYIVFVVGTAAAAFSILGGVIGPIVTMYKAMASGITKLIGLFGTKAVAQVNDTVLSEADQIAKLKQSIAQDKQTISQLRSNAATSSGVGPMLAFGAAMLMVGAGIYLAATGLAEFVGAFATLNSEQLSAVGMALLGFGVALVALAVVLYLVGTASSFAAGPVMAVGFAILMMGVGIGIAAAGMALLATAIGKAGPNFILAAYGMAIMLAAAAGLAIALYFAVPAIGAVSVSGMGAAIALGLLAGALVVAAIGAVILGPALVMMAEGLAGVLKAGGPAALVFGALGVGMLGLAVGMGAMMFLFSNPLGWLAIAAAMGLMAAAIAILVKGINSIDDQKLQAMAQMSSAFQALSDMEGEGTIVARITSDLENFKETMDSTVMAQVASLGTFNDVRQINNTRAETSVQNQFKMPDRIVVEANNTIHTQIGDKDFVTHVKKAVNDANWKPNDAATRAIVAAGNA